MSSIKLESNASGTGIFTIASPNSNTNRTLTLPDSTGTVVVTGGAQTLEFNSKQQDLVLLLDPLTPVCLLEEIQMMEI